MDRGTFVCALSAQLTIHVMSITTPGSTSQAQAAFAGSNHVANPNPGWAALPPEPDWQVVPPRSPLAKLWAGDGQRDDWHMLLAMIFSGIAFVWVSEKLYRGRSKHAATSSRARRAGLIGIGCFYIAHNIVIVVCYFAFAREQSCASFALLSSF